MSLETAVLLSKVLKILYYNVAEIRILLNQPVYENKTYSLELKKVGETCYFEDEESILLHIEGALRKCLTE